MPRRGPGFFVGSLIKAPYCTVAAIDPTFEPAGFEATFLKTEKPSDTARITTTDPLKTSWSATLTKGSDRDVLATVMVNSNISPWGLYRYSSAAIDWEVLVPTSIISSTNATGSASDVDEPVSSLDANYMLPTNTALDWTVRLGGYVTPSVGPTQKIFVVVSAILIGVPIAIYPKLSVTLLQSGTVVEVLGNRAVTSTSDQTFIFSLDVAALLDPTGANIRIQTSFDKGDGGSYGKLGTAIVYVEGTPPALDSGWILSPISDHSEDDDIPPTTDLPFYVSSAWNSTTFFASIVDDQVEHSPDVGSALSGIPINNVEQDKWYDGFIEAGVWFAGDAIFLSIGMTTSDKGPKSSITVEDISDVSIGGQDRATDMFLKKRCRIDFVATRDELKQLQQRLAWNRGKSGAFYFAAEPDIALKYQLFTAFWARLEEMTEPEIVLSADADATKDIQTLHRMSMTLVQKI